MKTARSFVNYSHKDVNTLAAEFTWYTCSMHKKRAQKKQDYLQPHTTLLLRTALHGTEEEQYIPGWQY